MANVLASIGRAIGQRARAWAKRRQGIDPPIVSLQAGRIYILPTRAGVIYGLILFTMLLGAMNYNNNLGFALTFLLAGVGIVSMHHCHHNLAGLKISALGVTPVFAGEYLQFRFVVDNPSAQARWQIRLGWDGESFQVSELAGGSREALTLELPTSQRGWHAAPRIQVSTHYPLGLLRAWSWVNMDLRGLVWPQPAKQAFGQNRGEVGRQDLGQDAAGEDDFYGLRLWRHGDPPRRIAWKLLARTGQKMISEYRSGMPEPVWIDWDSEPGTDPEQRIARLTRRVLQADAAQRRFGLRLPGTQLDPQDDRGHLQKCLESLALLPTATGTEHPA